VTKYVTYKLTMSNPGLNDASHIIWCFFFVFFSFFFFFDTNNVFLFCNLGSNKNRICSQVGSGSGPGPTPRAGPPSSWPWPLPTRGRANNIWPGPSDLPVGSGPVRGPQGPGPDRGQSSGISEVRANFRNSSEFF
jgi:hypothetical protein